MAIRLVASDLDGTLFGADHVPEPRTVDAVNAVVAAGLTFVAVTGRSYFGGAPLARSTGAELHWFIGSNGGHRLNLQTGALEERLVFDGATVESILWQLPTWLDGVGIGLEHATGFTFDDGFIAIHPKKHDGARRRDTASRSLADVGKVFVAHREASATDLIDLLAPLVPDGAHVTTSGASFVEVTPAGADKGAGLARLCAELDVSADDVIAFGDNHNDLTMLEWAGCGVAMANAVSGLIEVADEVTASNVEFGVASILEALVDS